MKKYIFNFTLIISVLIFLNTDLKSQPCQKGTKLEGIQEVHEYVLTNVFPVMAVKRAELDENLSVAEKEEINNLIIELEKIKSEAGIDDMDIPPMHGMNCENSEHKCEGKCHGKFSDMDSTDFEEMKAFHEQIKEIMLQAKEIADNHTSEIEAIMTEIEPQKEVWKTDIEKILDENGIEPGKFKAHKAKMHQYNNDENCENFEQMEINPFERMFLPHQFLLMNFIVNGKANKLSEITSAEIYPNPATDKFTIDFELSENADVTIKILNNSGIQQQIISENDLEAGTISKEINSAEFDEGIYFIILESENGIVTRKVFIEK